MAVPSRVTEKGCWWGRMDDGWDRSVEGVVAAAFWYRCSCRSLDDGGVASKAFAIMAVVGMDSEGWGGYSSTTDGRSDMVDAIGDSN